MGGIVSMEDGDDSSAQMNYGEKEKELTKKNEELKAKEIELEKERERLEKEKKAAAEASMKNKSGKMDQWLRREVRSMKRRLEELERNEEE